MLQTRFHFHVQIHFISAIVYKMARDFSRPVKLNFRSLIFVAIYQWLTIHFFGDTKQFRPIYKSRNKNTIPPTDNGQPHIFQVGRLQIK